MSEAGYTLVVAVNDRRVLQENLLASPDLRAGEPDLLIEEGFASAAAAYNHAIDRSVNDLMVFVHQDVYLPAGWFSALARSVSFLDALPKRWGVAGCCGSREGANGGVGRMLTNGWGIHGGFLSEPEEVETLDEVVLVMRKSSGLRFDTALPHFHLYGVDVCLSARAQGLGCYAIQAFCVHNTNQLLTLPAEYWKAYDYVKIKWKQYLPIHTSCITISRFDMERRRKAVEKYVYTFRPRSKPPAKRVADPRVLLWQLRGTEWELRERAV